MFLFKTSIFSLKAAWSNISRKMGKGLQVYLKSHQPWSTPLRKFSATLPEVFQHQREDPPWHSLLTVLLRKTSNAWLYRQSHLSVSVPQRVLWKGACEIQDNFPKTSPSPASLESGLLPFLCNPPAYFAYFSQEHLRLPWCRCCTPPPPLWK